MKTAFWTVGAIIITGVVVPILNLFYWTITNAAFWSPERASFCFFASLILLTAWSAYKYDSDL